MIPKYQYHVQLWGGFYNPEHKHGKTPGDYFFDTVEERTAYIKELDDLAVKLNAHHLARNLTEGYCCGIRTVLHRVVEWEGKEYYTNYDLGVNYSFEAAHYFMDWKWTPGCNDYPLGEEHDYDNFPPRIIQEWITGADQTSTE